MKPGDLILLAQDGDTMRARVVEKAKAQEAVEAARKKYGQASLALVFQTNTET